MNVGVRGNIIRKSSFASTWQTPFARVSKYCTPRPTKRKPSDPKGGGGGEGSDGRCMFGLVPRHFALRANTERVTQIAAVVELVENERERELETC